jgi:hypothetical protein
VQLLKATLQVKLERSVATKNVNSADAPVSKVREKLFHELRAYSRGAVGLQKIDVKMSRVFREELFQKNLRKRTVRGFL